MPLKPKQEQKTPLKTYISAKPSRKSLTEDFHYNLKNLDNVAYNKMTGTYILLFNTNKIGEKNMDYLRTKGEIVDVLYAFRDSSHLSASELENIPICDVITLSVILRPKENQ